MGKFDEIRRIMKDFKGDVDGLANRKIEEIETAKQISENQPGAITRMTGILV